MVDIESRLDLPSLTVGLLPRFGTANVDSSEKLWRVTLIVSRGVCR